MWFCVFAFLTRNRPPALQVRTGDTCQKWTSNRVNLQIPTTFRVHRFAVLVDHNEKRNWICALMPTVHKICSKLRNWVRGRLNPRDVQNFDEIMQVEILRPWADSVKHDEGWVCMCLLAFAVGVRAIFQSPSKNAIYQILRFFRNPWFSEKCYFRISVFYPFFSN